MSLEVIYVTRHGFRPAFNVDPATGTYSLAIRSPTGLPTDPPLTSYGVDQANDLAQHLLQVDPPIDQVYSSPYYRCLQTISPFVALKLKKRKDVAAADTDAAAAGDGRRPRQQQPSSISSSPSPSSDPGEGGGGKGGPGIRVEAGISEWSRVVPPRHGESIAQLHDRVAAAIGAIIEQSDREGARAIVLNTHAAVMIALGRVLTGRMPTSVDEEDFKAFTCGLSIYRRRPSRTPTGVPQAPPSGNFPVSTQSANRNAAWADGSGVCGGWDCQANSDCSFLRGGEERGWRFSGDEDFVSLGSGTLEDARAGLGVIVEKGESSGNNSSQPGRSKL
ncbi:phosphoglycerate mutase [Apiospora kogelbergensis]|uniref:Phosphoglycerate mutase n=1 Tax=Apiospora kogelbergensis TaxID=1337665 RepID=A0AAW0Q864_9PEZI